MINANNVKYYDLVLAHIVNNVDSNGRPSDVDIEDLITICNGEEDLPRVIGKEFEKRDFALVADTRGGYSIALKRNSSAAVFHKNGGFKAEFDSQQESIQAELERRQIVKEELWQSTKDEKVTQFLYGLRKQKHIAIAEEKAETGRIIDELVKLKLIELEGSFYVLTEKGFMLTEIGQTYRGYINNKSVMKTYGLFVDTAHNTFNILNIDKTGLDIVVDAYNTGEHDFFISGEKYIIKDLYKIKIFEFDHPAQFDSFISSARANNKFVGGALGEPLLMPDVLGAVGKEVTRNFLKGRFGYMKAEAVTKVIKPSPDFTMDIFISHSSSDSEIAEGLLSLIRKAFNVESSKIRCTSVPGYKLEVGAATDSQLKQEIFSSKVFIAIITTDSVDSTYVTFELGARWGSGLPLLPLICDSAGISLLKAPLTGINALDATVTADILQFVENLGKHLDKKQESVGSYFKEVEALKELNLGKNEQKAPKRIKARTVKR